MSFAQKITPKQASRIREQSDNKESDISNWSGPAGQVLQTGKTNIIPKHKHCAREVRVRTAHHKEAKPLNSNLGMDQNNKNNDSKKRNVSFAETSTPKRNYSNARRELERLMNDDEFEQPLALNQKAFQDVSSHLSRNMGEEATGDTQSLGVTLDESQSGTPAHLAILAEKMDKIVDPEY